MRAPRLLFIAILAAFVALPIAGARADQPTRSVQAIDVEFTGGVCGFPVRVHLEGFTDSLAFDVNGAGTTRLFAGGSFKGTLTNLDTGKTLRVNFSGPAAIETTAEGQEAINVGPTVAVPVHPIKGEPGIWLLKGRLVTDFDAAGNLIARSFVGTSTNLCLQLAA